MNKFVDFRNAFFQMINSEMMGPGSETSKDSENEVITESPLQRYSVGILYPQGSTMKNVKENSKEGEDDDTDEQGDTDDPKVNTDNEIDEPLDLSVNTANQYYPSAIGISFYIKGASPNLEIEINCAQYKRLILQECITDVEVLPDEIIYSPIFNQYFQINEGNLILKEKISSKEIKRLVNLSEHQGYRNALFKLYTMQTKGWKRIPPQESVRKVPINLGSTNEFFKDDLEVTNGLRLYTIKRPTEKADVSLVTISLINTNKNTSGYPEVESTFFQCKFKVKKVNGRFIEYDNFNTNYIEENKGDNEQIEENSMALLYRNKRSYATGHGCGVGWKLENEEISLIETRIIPFYEVPQMDFNIDELGDEATQILSMKHLSDISPLNKSEIINNLRTFSLTYKGWIDKLRLDIEEDQSINELKKTANKHIDLCEGTFNRMWNGIGLLENDNGYLFKAFQLSNKSMLMQRVHTEIQQESKWPENDLIQPNYNDIDPEDASWRPFQLAFLLINISGILNQNKNEHEISERDIVDLIWFPTGGGKTEAYLGVSALTIFFRRMKFKENGSGTTIIMRYTLRLLTSQQFQRATTLICACEKIRGENSDLLGQSEISIGLWIGTDSTPNKVDDAIRALDKLTTGVESKNPFQVLACPWCGTKMSKEEGKGTWGYKPGERPKRLIIFCPNSQCDFSKELPIKVVDEDIYRSTPTLLFGTVDKFALIPWKGEVSKLFALDEGNKNLSPDLIIQDELHLISGPLGTIVGLYETAIDALCSAKGRKPKIISSTATIRRAKEQVKALFNRNVAQFPPPGLEIKDSFFAREATLEKSPGRLYVGIMAAGRTQTTTQIRLMSALIHFVKELEGSEEIKDKFSTLVGYFNTIRELGKSRSLIQADIKEQTYRIAKRRSKDNRNFRDPVDLTSNVDADEIPKILERLNVEFPDDDAISILLATNMISVGVDVERLGLMTIIGQPKTTSEYIQASSRVGRKYPGLIYTLYDGARPRDRSHYEQFTSYHQAFYKFVEPTSITPFSSAARERALHAVLVTLVRHLTGLNKNNDASNFTNQLDGLANIKSLILDRIADIMPEEVDDSTQELEQYIQKWNRYTGIIDNLNYSHQKPHLLYPYSDVRGDYWRTLQSMRNVDVDCNIKLKD